MEISPEHEMYHVKNELIDPIAYRMGSLEGVRAFTFHIAISFFYFLRQCHEL